VKQKRYHIVIFTKTLFFFILFLLFTTIVIWQIYNQSSLHNLLNKALYPEMKSRMPTFIATVRTDRSSTHVISYLPSSVLPENKFHEEAAAALITYIEHVAEEGENFSLNPNNIGDNEISILLTPRFSPKSENFVVLIGPTDPIPSILKTQLDDPSLFAQLLRERKSFGITHFLENGAVSFIRYSEDKTWQYALPREEDHPLGYLQQLNLVFNIESWKRTTVLSPRGSIEHIPNKNKVLFDAGESLWNTFGRLLASSQESIPDYLMQERLQKRTLSKTWNISYYPYDQKAERIYKNAPKEAVIK